MRKVLHSNHLMVFILFLSFSAKAQIKIIKTCVAEVFNAPGNGAQATLPGNWISVAGLGNSNWSTSTKDIREAILYNNN